MGAPLSSLSAPTPHRTHTMGRRKIDIEYLQDDRVRKVTFCKRKGGLFKKAEDLAVLCGCEVTVLISNNNKTYEMVRSRNGPDEMPGRTAQEAIQRFNDLQADKNAVDPNAAIYRQFAEYQRQITELQAQLATFHQQQQLALGVEVEQMPILSGTVLAPDESQQGMKRERVEEDDDVSDDTAEVEDNSDGESAAKRARPEAAEASSLLLGGCGTEVPMIPVDSLEALSEAAIPVMPPVDGYTGPLK